MSTVNLALHKDLILKTPKGEVRSVMEENSYIWKDDMKAVTFCFWNLEPTPCLYRFGLAFLSFIVDPTFGKILNT